MKHLMYLNLSINQIGSEGLAMIGDVLPETIQHLNFSENRITQEGFMDFSTNLKRIPNLLALVLYGNRNGPTAIQCLGENFKYISKLQVLNLGATSGFVEARQAENGLLSKRERRYNSVASRDRGGAPDTS